MTSIEKLVLMANQIATNLAYEPDTVGATAHHIRQFWDPRMKRLISENREGLSIEADAAIALLSAETQSD
jgi:formate dehydrogenase subunit delta